MGQAASRALGMAKKPLRNYNVQNRADKVFEKMENIPNPAPKHASTIEPLSRFREGMLIIILLFSFFFFFFFCIRHNIRRDLFFGTLKNDS